MPRAVSCHSGDHNGQLAGLHRSPPIARITVQIARIDLLVSMRLSPWRQATNKSSIREIRQNLRHQGRAAGYREAGPLLL
jgi:hypothetical protein